MVEWMLRAPIHTVYPRSPFARAPASSPSAMSAIPQGYATVTPSLTVRDAAAALEFYTRAFGAEVLFQRYAGTEFEGGDGKKYRLVADTDLKGVFQ